MKLLHRYISNVTIIFVLIISVRPLGQAVKTPPFHGGNTGSSPVRVIIGELAQLGEHLPYKQRVGGSIPSFSTTEG